MNVCCLCPHFPPHPFPSPGGDTGGFGKGGGKTQNGGGSRRAGGAVAMARAGEAVAVNKEIEEAGCGVGGTDMEGVGGRTWRGLGDNLGMEDGDEPEPGGGGGGSRGLQSPHPASSWQCVWGRVKTPPPGDLG